MKMISQLRALAATADAGLSLVHPLSGDEARCLVNQIEDELEVAAGDRALLEQIVDAFIDGLDGEPSGSDLLDFALARYGYRPSKVVVAAADSDDTDG